MSSYWEESLGIDIDPLPGSHWDEPAVNGTGSLGPYGSHWDRSLISLEHNDYY